MLHNGSETEDRGILIIYKININFINSNRNYDIPLYVRIKNYELINAQKL